MARGGIPAAPLPQRDGVDAVRLRLPQAGPWLLLRDHLVERIPLPANEIDAMLAAGEFADADGRPVPADAPFVPRSVVWVHREPPPEVPVPFDIEVLHRDERIVVVDKPPFLATTPRGVHVRETVLTRLRSRLGLPRLAPAHRLDRLTSGVLVLTTEQRWRGAYQQVFAAGAAGKTYLAAAPVRAGLELPTTVRLHLAKPRGQLQAAVVDGATPTARPGSNCSAHGRRAHRPGRAGPPARRRPSSRTRHGWASTASGPRPAAPINCGPTWPGSACPSAVTRSIRGSARSTPPISVRRWAWSRRAWPSSTPSTGRRASSPAPGCRGRGSRPRLPGRSDPVAARQVTRRDPGPRRSPTVAGVQPPSAPREPHQREHHGDVVVDDYAWMADLDDPRLAAYLQAENDHAAAQSAELAPLADTIVAEILDRTVETDLGVPVRFRGWWWYSRTVRGLDYPIHGRVPDGPAGRPVLTPDGPPEGEHLLLDENAAAAGCEHFALGALELTHDDRLMAWSADRAGDEHYDVVVSEVAGGTVIDESLRQVGEGLAWSLDGRHLLYTRLDETYRPHQIWRHEIGTDPSADVLVLHEPDERFYLAVGASRDDRTILLSSSSKTTAEIRLLDAADPTAAARLVAPRRPDVIYDIEACGPELVGWHNAGRANFEIARVVPGADPLAWEPLGWTAPDELVLGVDLLAHHAVVSLRRAGRTALRLVPRTADGFGMPRDLTVPGDPGTVGLGAVPEVTSPTIQVVAESLGVPSAVYDLDLTSGQWTLLKQRQVPGYDLGRLRETRLWATAPDGARVPVSLVHRDDVRPDGTAAGLLYGYGAYGTPTDPWFSVARLSLLDRGVVFAIAHVRGGTELGWDWYEQGRLAAKGNSFTDFVACADALVEAGWVHPDRLAAEGGSAGGWLVAAAADRAPDRFRIVHAQVPFVDPLTTLLDPELPLTVTEWEEWGDPLADPAAYRRIKGWSPCEQATATGPDLLVTSSVNDIRVLVTEPAKWVAKTRAAIAAAPAGPACRTVVFRTELEAGHAGVSGRYQAWAQTAWEWAVLLDRLDATRPRYIGGR